MSASKKNKDEEVKKLRTDEKIKQLMAKQKYIIMSSTAKKKLISQFNTCNETMEETRRLNPDYASLLSPATMNAEDADVLG